MPAWLYWLLFAAFAVAFVVRPAFGVLQARADERMKRAWPYGRGQERSPW